MKTDKQKLFQQLVVAAQSCGRCVNLCERTAVLSELNGNINPKVMFVAEAPGRNGGDRTRVPLEGDKSGANFTKFIDSINLVRAEIFITNSVLCNPRKESGANRKPTQIEIVNCSNFLRQQIEILNPQIIVTLGSVALEALKTIETHEFSLRLNAGKVLEWNNKLLVPLYHPSPQVLASHRRLNEQLEDYQVLLKLVRRIS